MEPPANLDEHGPEDTRANRWLAALRTGSPAEKAHARLGLAAHFESRGMVAEAVDLLVTNAREGYRDAELFQSLSRMYRRLGDEYLAASAALEATRLSGSQPSKVRQPALDPDPIGVRLPKPAPPTSTPRPVASSPAPWRLPLRVAGWIVVLATTVAAAAVAVQSPFAGALYLISAVALGLLLSGSGTIRQLVRLPDGPLGEGALLFVWLLTLLAAGALLPRPLSDPAAPAPATETTVGGAPGMPSPTPSPSTSQSGVATPSPPTSQ